MKKTDSKYFQTAARMDEAFLTLLQKKEFAYITVKEICAAAGVNRSTFYLHYETICWRKAFIMYISSFRCILKETTRPTYRTALHRICYGFDRST